MSEQHQNHPLDRRAARIIAIAVCFAMVALLGVIHRDDILPSTQAGLTEENSAFASCVADRHGTVDQMVADGVIGPDKESLFKSRAKALCRDLNPG